MKLSAHVFFRFILVTGIIIFLNACGGADERKAKYLKKGKEYLENNNYDKASVEFRNVLQIDPKFAEGYFYMGQVEEKNKEFKKAAGYYKKAIEIDPDYSDAKVKLAKIYVLAGSSPLLDEAKGLLQGLDQGESANVEAKLVLATIEYKTGSKSNAKATLEKIVNQHLTLIEGVGLLSTIYLTEGDAEKAESILKRGVDANPDSATLRVELAKVMVKNSDLEGAEKYLKEAVTIYPDQFLLKVALSVFYANSNEMDKAIYTLRDAISQDENDYKRYLVLTDLIAARVNPEAALVELNGFIKNKPDLYELKFALFRLYKKMERRDEAKGVLREIIDTKKYDIEAVEARNLLADYLLEGGNQREAKKYVDQVIEQYPNNDGALLLNGRLALQNLDPASAINDLRIVIKNDPGNGEAAFLLAQAHELNKESDLAESVLKRTVEANPIDETVHVNYARYLIGKNQIDKAEDVIDKAILFFKDSYELLSLKLKIVVSRHNENEVLALLDQMAQALPESADVNMTRGQYFLSRKDMTEALKEFDLAYQKAIDKFKPLEMIVRIHLFNKQPEKAIAKLNERLDKNADDSIANLLMGQMLSSQGKVVDARDRFVNASKESSTWILPYINLASTYLLQNDLDAAAEILKNAIPKVVAKVQLQMKLASIYEQQKSFSNAMNIYQQVLEKNSSNKLARNNYASLLIDHGTKQDVSKALDLLNGFEKLAQPALLDTLGWAYAKSGNYLKAVEIMRPIVNQAPDVAVFRYHLGYALYHSGDKNGAKEHLKKAASSDQSFYGKDDAAQILASI